MEKMEEDRLWYQIFVYDGVQIVEVNIEVKAYFCFVS